jgi:hypothetical protein
MATGEGDDPGRTSAGATNPSKTSEGAAANVGLPPAAAPTNHGKTQAAWITTWVIVAGGVLCTFGAIFQSTLLIVAGGVVILIGLVIGRILRAMGMGQGHPLAAPPPRNTSPRP